MAFDFKALMGDPVKIPQEKKVQSPKEQTEPIEESIPEKMDPPPYKAESGTEEAEGMEKTILFGGDVNKNPIPFGTLHDENHFQKKPVLVFEDPSGNRFGMRESLLSKHLMMLGGIGSGKTNAFNFIIEALKNKMTDKDIMFIFDTKGDFYEQFYEKDNPDHILIGNGALYEDETYFWNIFDEIREPDGTFNKRSEITCKEIAKQLFKGRGSDSQPFFELAAADLVSKVLCHYIRSHTNKGFRPMPLNNQQLLADLRRAGAKEYTGITELHPDFRSARLYFGDPDKPMTPQALGVFGYINAMLNDLFVGVFAENTGKGPFSMRKLVREKGKKIVFIEYDLSVGEVLAPMYRILIDLALKEALGRSRKERGNVYFMIDEFKLLPNLMHIDDALNFGRSLGVKVCAGLQSINQLFDIYGEERGKVLAAGFMNSFCFQTWDYDSRKYISERFGDNYVNYSFRVQNNPIYIQREGHVVEDWDILKLDVGEAFINLVGEKPFKFQFSNFDDPHDILS